jgi:hypothetical protein
VHVNVLANVNVNVIPSILGYVHVYEHEHVHVWHCLMSRVDSSPLSRYLSMRLSL